MAGVVVDFVVAAAPAALLVPTVMPFRIDPMTEDFVVCGPALEERLAFVATVPALPSLVSLVLLARRPFRVPGRYEAALAAVAPPLRRALEAAVVPLVEEVDISDVVNIFFVPLARLTFAFSTMLERRFAVVVAAEREVPEALSGEPGRAMNDLVGEVCRSRFVRREFDDVGERTWPGLRRPLSTGGMRARFLVPSTCSTAFSLFPEISLLPYLLECLQGTQFCLNVELNLPHALIATTCW